MAGWPASPKDPQGWDHLPDHHAAHSKEDPDPYLSRKGDEPYVYHLAEMQSKQPHPGDDHLPDPCFLHSLCKDMMQSLKKHEGMIEDLQKQLNPDISFDPAHNQMMELLQQVAHQSRVLDEKDKVLDAEYRLHRKDVNQLVHTGKILQKKEQELAEVEKKLAEKETQLAGKSAEVHELKLRARLQGLETLPSAAPDELEDLKSAANMKVIESSLFRYQERRRRLLERLAEDNTPEVQDKMLMEFSVAEKMVTELQDKLLGMRGRCDV